MRARSHGAGGVGVVLFGRYGFDLVPVAVRQIEHLLGDSVPGNGFARAGHVVRAIRSRNRGLRIALPVAQQVEDRARHVHGEREPADLVVHHRDPIELVLRVGDPVRQDLHRPDEVMPIADHPRTAEDVMPGTVADRQVARGLRLPVHAQRAERLRLVVRLPRPIEHIIRAHVHERDVMLRADAGEQRRPGRVRLPRRHTPLVGLGPVHGRVRAAVDHRPVQTPVEPAVLRRIGHVERVDVAVVEALKAMLLHIGTDRTAQLPVAAGHQRAPRHHRQRVPQHRVIPVRLGKLALLERNRPVDAQPRVGEVDERVRLLEFRRPVRVDQIRVRGTILQRLEAVAHPTRDINRLRRVQHRRKHPSETAAGTQIHPRAEHRTRRHADELVPRLRMNPTRHPTLRVEADVVLHRTEIRQPQPHHLCPLPVLLEPTTIIPMHAQIEHQHAGNVRLRNLQFLLELHHPLTFPRIPGSFQRTRWRGACLLGHAPHRTNHCPWAL